MRTLCLAVQILALMYGQGYPTRETQAPSATPSPAVSDQGVTDVCTLLDASEIREVQGETLRETKRSEENRGAFTAEQCFYRTTSFSASISLLVARPNKTRASGPRDYWRERFHPHGGQARASDGKHSTGQAEQAPQKKEQPPRPLADLGEEAFWVGNHIAGAVYVLQGDLFFRLSVGGPGQEQQKIEKSTELARKALGRLGAKHAPTRE